MIDLFEVSASFPYLDSSRSHRFYRAFYVPFASGANTHFSEYVVLKNKRTKARR